MNAYAIGRNSTARLYTSSDWKWNMAGVSAKPARGFAYAYAYAYAQRLITNCGALY